MIKAKIDLLSKDSIKRVTELIDELSNFYSSEETMRELTEYASDLVKSNVSEYAKGHTDQIYTEVIGNTGKVYTNSDVLIYNEYGTGIVGSNNPHPEADSWVYDTNQHGESGWWYPTTEEDTNPYKWVDGSGQLRAWTKGLPANAGFYKSREELKTIIGNKLNTMIERKFSKYGE